MVSKSKSPGGGAPSRIKAVQWSLPVSFRGDGEPVTLQEVCHGETSSLAFSALSDEQRAELTARRIELQPEFELGMIGAGVIDKKRAIAEVRARSSIGRTLMEIEARTIQQLLEAAKSEAK